MSDVCRAKMIQMYNDPIITPMIDRIIEDICIVGGKNHDDVYNYIVFGENVINPHRPYLHSACGDIRGMLDTSVRSYNTMIHEDIIPEDKEYFIRKIQQNLKFDNSDSSSKIIYDRFIGRCIYALTHIGD